MNVGFFRTPVVILMQDCPVPPRNATQPSRIYSFVKAVVINLHNNKYARQKRVEYQPPTSQCNSAVETIAAMRFVVSHKAVPTNGIAVVIDAINERTENRRGIRP